MKRLLARLAAFLLSLVWAQSREGRNKQRDLTAGIANAVAIAMVVTAFVGPQINPSLATLSLAERLQLLVGGLAFHLLARYIVNKMEDRP